MSHTTAVPYFPPKETRAFVPEYVAGFNSPATYNTCMIASLFLGLKNTWPHLKVGKLFEEVFKIVWRSVQN